MNTLDILSSEGVSLNKECVICYNKFIDIKDAEYNSFLEKIKQKYNLINIDFEGETTCLCYDARFECSVCKNNICNRCIYNMPDNKNGICTDSFAMFCNGYTRHVEKTLSMGETGIITCPICRTERNKLMFYMNKNVLHEEN